MSRSASFDRAGFDRTRVRARRRAARGFTLIEVLVALAVISVTLPAIGTVIAATTRGARSTEDRLVLAGIAESLLTGLSDRRELRAGSSAGETGGHRWRIDISELPRPQADATAPQLWAPLAIAIRVETRGGYRVQVNTVRLAPLG